MRGGRQLPALRADIAKGSTTANQLNQFKQQVAELEARLEGLKAVLAGAEGRGRSAAADSDAGHAVESGDSRLQAGADGHQGSCTPSGRSRCSSTGRTTTSGCSSIASASSRESSTSATSTSARKRSPSRTRRSPRECVATTFVLLESKPAAAAAAKTQLDDAPSSPELVRIASTAMLVAGSVRVGASRRAGQARRHAARAAVATPPASCARAACSRGIHLQPGGPARSVCQSARRAAPTRRRAKRADGLSGLSTAELIVRGVLQSRGAYIALVSGPEGKTFTAHVNDRLVGRNDSKHHSSGDRDHAGSQRPPLAHQATRGAEGT